MLSAAEWLEDKGEAFCTGISVGTLDLSGPYRAVFSAMTPQATLVADPFHVIRLCRRRVQNESLGHRGRKPNPSTVAGGSSRRPTNGSTKAAGPSSWDCFGPGTRRAR